MEMNKWWIFLAFFSSAGVITLVCTLKKKSAGELSTILTITFFLTKQMQFNKDFNHFFGPELPEAVSIKPLPTFLPLTNASSECEPGFKPVEGKCIPEGSKADSRNAYDSKLNNVIIPPTDPDRLPARKLCSPHLKLIANKCRPKNWPKRNRSRRHRRSPTDFTTIEPSVLLQKLKAVASV